MNPNNAAFPQPFNETGPVHPDFGGLTTREYFAGRALQGLLSNPGGPVQANSNTGWQSTVNCSRADVAGEAVAYADALLAALAAPAGVGVSGAFPVGWRELGSWYNTLCHGLMYLHEKSYGNADTALTSVINELECLRNAQGFSESFRSLGEKTAAPGIAEAQVDIRPGTVPSRWFASGPEGHFFADDYELTEKLIRQAGFDRDDWTVTDLHNPHGALP